MKKVFAVLLAMVMMTSLCAFAHAEDDSLQKVLDKGTLVLGFDPGFPPMGFTTEDGDYVGFDIDLAYELCALLGVELQLQPIDWSAKELELNSGNIDVIWNGFSINPEREAALTFSMPYINNEMVLLVKADAPYQTLADLAGKKLGLQAGSTAVDALNNAADFKASLGEVAEFDMNTVLLLDLEAGGVDVALLDVIVANYYIVTEGAQFRALEETLAPEMMGIGCRKNDLALVEAINDALIELAFNGVMEEIAINWFGEDITIIAETVAMAEEGK